MEGNGLTDEVGRLAGALALKFDQSEQVQGSRVGGFVIEHLPADGLGVRQTPCLAVLEHNGKSLLEIRQRHRGN